MLSEPWVQWLVALGVCTLWGWYQHRRGVTIGARKSSTLVALAIQKYGGDDMVRKVSRWVTRYSEEAGITPKDEDS